MLASLWSILDCVVPSNSKLHFFFSFGMCTCICILGNEEIYRTQWAKSWWRYGHTERFFSKCIIWMPWQMALPPQYWIEIRIHARILKLFQIDEKHYKCHLLVILRKYIELERCRATCFAWLGRFAFLSPSHFAAESLTSTRSHSHTKDVTQENETISILRRRRRRNSRSHLKFIYFTRCKLPDLWDSSYFYCSRHFCANFSISLLYFILLFSPFSLLLCHSVCMCLVCASLSSSSNLATDFRLVAISNENSSLNLHQEKIYIFIKCVFIEELWTKRIFPLAIQSVAFFMYRMYIVKMWRRKKNRCRSYGVASSELSSRFRLSLTFSLLIFGMCV